MVVSMTILLIPTGGHIVIIVMILVLILVLPFLAIVRLLARWFQVSGLPVVTTEHHLLAP
jgi:hypothetical protein